jgi:catechol 2,3-dioxygenase
MNAMTTTKPATLEPVVVDPRVRIGHVHLKVSDLERSLAFYCNVLGFEMTGRLGNDAAFLSAGGYHHHIALNTWESRGGSAPPSGSTGLFHVALLYPDRAAVAAVARRVRAHGIEITSARDHGVAESVYFNDPDCNGIEVMWDRPMSAWPRTPDGRLIPLNDQLDLDALLAE